MTTEQIKETTLAQITEQIEYYHQLQQEIDRLQLSKEIAKKVITDAFEVMGNPSHYDTPGGLRARIQLRFRESIKVEEARSLLSQDLFDKLLKVSEYQAFSVRQLKEKEEQSEK